MASTEHATPHSPLASPEIRISRPEYTSIPQRIEDDTSESERDDERRVQGVDEPGLGIQMAPMLSPTSPGNMYSQESTPKDKSPYFLNVGPRSPFARTPDTLHSFGSNSLRARTDPMTERLIAHRAMQSTQWKVHWRTPALMVFCFLAGVVFAVGQDILYRHLHHMHISTTEAKDRWVLYGRALAYLSKVAFGGCVILVYRQRSWRTFRDRALTVLSIDQLFDALDDPSLFGNWEVISNAPVPVTIALVFWLIPVATMIFSPGALTFGTYLDRQIVNATIPNLDFSTESYKNYRIRNGTADGSLRSMMFYNTTDRSKEPTQEGWFDYYDQPSSDLNRIAILMAYSNMRHPNIMLGARQRMCGGSFNCTYQQTFVGPAYQCLEIANGTNDDAKLAELGAPFNTSVLVPKGRYIYHANVNMGDYAHPQNATFKKGPGGVPDGPIPDDLGVFKSEPVLWIGYSVNSTKPLPKDSPYAVNWTHLYEPHVIRCMHYEARYMVFWNYSDPYFHAMTMKKEYLKPIVDTNFTRLADGQLNENDPQPAENFISPRTNVPLYKKTAAYHAIGYMFRTFLKGKVAMDAPLPGPSFVLPEFTEVTQTRLVEKNNSEPKVNLGKEIEDLYTDMVLSMLSVKEMIVVQSSNTTLNRTRYQPSFVYNPNILWSCYAPLMFVTFLILLLGFWTIIEDGTTFSAGFSRILVTTRNTTLDDISRGACLGNDPFPRELMLTKLRFGVLGEGLEVDCMGRDSMQSVGHCAFGVASEVTPIKKGMPYAGMQRRRRRWAVDKEEEK